MSLRRDTASSPRATRHSPLPGSASCQSASAAGSLAPLMSIIKG